MSGGIQVGWMTAGGQFYGSIQAMPKRQQATAKPVYDPAIVASLINAARELISAQADYDRLDAPGGAKWDRLQAARFSHAEVTAKFNGATK